MAAILVVLTGHLQLLGQLSGLETLEFIGLCTSSSPLPTVFHYPEIEARIELDIIDIDGAATRLNISREAFARVPGPLARRAPFVAPVFQQLPHPLWSGVYRRAFCGDRPMLVALGYSGTVRRATVNVWRGSTRLRSMSVRCR